MHTKTAHVFAYVREEILGNTLRVLAISLSARIYEVFQTVLHSLLACCLT